MATHSPHVTPPIIRRISGQWTPTGTVEGALARQPEADWDGVTKPRGKVGARRFLKDVIVELDLAERERVDQCRRDGAPDRSDARGGAARRRRPQPDMLARAVAERAGLDHIDLCVFKVDMAAANIISSAKAKRYEAVPVAFDDETTLSSRWPTPATSWRSTTSP